jgi:uncharacterized membrane protein
MKQVFAGVVVTIVVVVAAFAVAIASGMYNVAAEEEHAGISPRESALDLVRQIMSALDAASPPS